MSYGKFTGGQHFKKLNVKNVKYSKPVKLKRASIEQIAELKLLGLNFQIGSISEEKAIYLINKITKQKNDSTSIK